MLGESKELDEFLTSGRHVGRSELVRQVRAAYQQAIEFMATNEERVDEVVIASDSSNRERKTPTKGTR
jgi:metal-responsive CopG/Arc/MetJ family transcriptional regulator